MIPESQKLPNLTPKQLTALLEIHRRWMRQNVDRTTDGWRYGSSTVSRLKREGLIERTEDGRYRPTDKALRMLPSGVVGGHG